MKPKSLTLERGHWTDNSPLPPFELKKGSVQSEPRTKEAFNIPQDEDIYQSFFAEAMEHLETIEINLLNMEQSPDEPEWINALFRSFHTVKGVAGFLNLEDIHTFSHAMQSLDSAAVPDGLVKSHQPNLIKYDSQVKKANSQNYLSNIFKFTVEA